MGVSPYRKNVLGVGKKDIRDPVAKYTYVFPQRIEIPHVQNCTLAFQYSAAPFVALFSSLALFFFQGAFFSTPPLPSRVNSRGGYWGAWPALSGELRPQLRRGGRISTTIKCSALAPGAGAPGHRGGRPR